MACKNDIVSELSFFRVLIVRDRENNTVACGSVYIGNQSKLHYNKYESNPFEIYGLICNIMVNPDFYAGNPTQKWKVLLMLNRCLESLCWLY